MNILKWLGLERPGAEESPASEVESLRRIARKLDALPEDEARYLAAFAYLLGRVARADLEISSQEARQMEDLVAELGGLSREQATLVVEVARQQHRLFGQVDDFLVTRELNRVADRDQKLHILECLFAVAAAEGGISSREDQEIRQIASELLLEHRDFIAVRRRFRDDLNVLKDPSAAE
ncbi:MAG: hypothetical protein Kow00109_13470 [Acidobacteriota bacterium]